MKDLQAMKPRHISNRLGILTALAFTALLVLPACSSNGGGGTTPYTNLQTGQVTVPTTNGGVPQLSAPAGLISQKQNLQNTQYVVFAWNDLGMHCLNPSYDAAVVLPPYNTLWAQIVKRGNPPQVVTQRFSVEYSIVGNTYSYGKSVFGKFWDNVLKLFGVNIERNKGLNLVDLAISNGLSGSMVNKSDHFEVDGIPLTPILDNGTWTPYQVAQITVKDSSGSIVASTYTTAPTSEEMNCAKCHGTSNTFDNILATHDKNEGTTLVSQKPVLCASCHGSPVLNLNQSGSSGKFLSQAMHTKHSTVTPQPNCYDCHPGANTNCSRSIAHTAADGNCTSCHGTLAAVGNSITAGRVPWVNEPNCIQCHPGVSGVDTGSVLYRNAPAHGGLYCASCHSSPHAMVPTSVMPDNYQALQYQGKALTIGACETCHKTSRGGGSLGEYMEEHGGTNPQQPNACNICHTGVTSTNVGNWPHNFQWLSR
jgi:hypothetical protein